MRDLYAEVTARIVAELEAGVKPWEKPWRTNKHAIATLPQNLHTGRSYQGVNTLVLWCEAIAKGYPSHAWATYKQVADMGGHVRKGEKATPVIYVGMKENEEGGQKVYRPFARWFMVFNHAQLEGIAQPTEREVTPTDPKVNHIAKSCGAVIRYGYPQACYMTVPDIVAMPCPEDFITPDAFARTLFHELAHWTGRDTRLDRQFGKRFGDEAYAFEEMVAELTSAFICARIGMPYANENAEYIGAWVRRMKADSKAIFAAAAAAARASEYLYPSVDEDAD